MSSSNSSSIVISFSIAILLLLTLLLLISYNSKCKMDNIERFENENVIPNNEHFQELLKQQQKQKENAHFSVASNSNNYVNLDAAANPVQGSVNPNDKKSGYTSTTGSYMPESTSTSFGETFVGSTNNDIDDGNSCFLRDRLTSSDLLPQDSANSKWAQINPAGSGMLGDQNFLTAGYHVGINTIGQSLRNANLQLRSEPPNPQVAVSPWGISTIEPDVRAVSFEIGSSPTF